MHSFRFACLSVALTLTAMLSGCGSSSAPAPTLSLTPSSAAVGAGGSAQFTATTNFSNTVQWSVNGVAGGNSTVGTVSSTGLYMAPTGTAGQTVTVSALDVGSPGVMASAQVSVVGAGTVAATANGQVASYTINLPSAGTVYVNFGAGATYGRNTWTVSSPANGGPTTVLVAGMEANTTFHMQAVVTLAGGTMITDADHTFSAGQSLPTSVLPTVNITAPGIPQPGVELLSDRTLGALFYDLQGNLLWGYSTPEISVSDQLQPAKLLADGNVLLQIAPLSSYPLDSPPPPDGTIFEVREVDLANTTIRSLNLADLQTSLNAFAYKDSQGSIPQLQDIHHDVVVNPNTGHWIIDANYVQTLSGVTGYPAPVAVLGDIILDVDPAKNFAVTWVFDEFNVLDVNRQPYQFPDWTHSNALLYSADDKNLLVSLRHQDWVLKVNYNDGAGDASVIWKLGYQGDFTLLNSDGTADANIQDWNYAQHEPSFTTSNTTGVFGLTLMDNGDDRQFTAGYTCPVALSNGKCLYSRAPIFTIDETGKTAKLGNPAVSSYYNSAGGNSNVLPNGNNEADYSTNPAGSQIVESTVGDSPTLVWQMSTPGATQYRAHRLGSLYPGVQWAQ
jgi:arylsulfate sulfotransferase